MDDEYHRFNVRNDPFDVMNFRRIFEESGKLQETLDPKRLATAPELGQDTFDALYKYVAQLRDAGEVDPTYHFNRGLLEKAMGTPEYARLRESTQQDATSSAIATEVIAEELLKNLPEEDRQAVNEYAKTNGDLSNALSKLKALEDLTKQGHKLTPGLKGARMKLQQALPGLQQAAQAAQPAFGQACQSRQAKAVFRAALTTATQELESAMDFLGGWGLDAGHLQKMPAKERMELMRKVQRSQKIRELNKLLGRMKRLALTKRYTRATMEPNEVADVKLSNDLARVLPSELVYLAEPELEVLFLEKFANHKLLTYEMKGKETFGRGPILAYNDNSGSMMAGEGGITAEVWSKSVTLAMADIALKDRRTIGVGNFGSRNELEFIEVPHTLPPQERMRRLLHAAETFFGGGTDFETPLAHALEQVEKSAFKKADILFVTDGRCDISPEFEERFLKVKKKKEFRLHTVLIGGTDETMKRLSDTCHSVYGLLADGDKVAGDLFEAV